MSNKQRGEITIKGPEDKDYILCLTLGAIAQIEEEIEGIESLADIDQVMGESPKMRDVVTIFVALLNGGGNDVTRKDMMKWKVDFKDLTKAIGDVFAASGFKDDDEEDDTSGN